MSVDSVIAKAVELARSAANDMAQANTVGDHLDVVAEGERVATHYFVCTDPGYVGWRWAVTIARASRARVATVDEVVLLPGPDALVAPAWVPWSERVQPGDLGVGVIWETPADDPRLVAGLTGADDLDGVAGQAPVHPSTWEIGLGRERVLSDLGREEAAHRWYDGDRGPDSPMAKSAALTCSTCGFLLTIGGPMGQAFGVCAQAMSPADGAVVSLAFGCGAHSQIAVSERVMTPEPVADSVGYDLLDLGHS